MVELDDEPVGFVQRYRLSDNPDWQRVLAPSGAPPAGAGIDYLIGSEALVGHGLGPAIIDAVVQDTWVVYPEIEAMVVSVAEGNRRSWRALEKAGFTRLWTGTLESEDPSDAGTSVVYVRHRIDGPPTDPPA